MDGSENIRIATAQPASRRRTRPSPRSLVVAGAVWVVLAGGALGIATALHEEPARTPPAPVSVAPQGLPLLFVYLDRRPPKEILDLPDLPAQVTRLEELARESNDPARWVELGTIAQRVGDLVAARTAFEQALTFDPGRLDATVGLLMNDGATGPEGLARAAAALAELGAANPRSQLVAFNTGMVAVYRADRKTIAAAFDRTLELGSSTLLGDLARRFAGATP